MNKCNIDILFSLICFCGSSLMAASAIFLDHKTNWKPLMSQGVFDVEIPLYTSIRNDSIDLNAKHFYLYSYFKDEAQGMYYAMSTNGLDWMELDGGKTIIKPKVGSQKLMRDPSVYQGPDGRFRLVWTTGWGGNDIGYSSSSDLIHWDIQRAIPVGKDIREMENCWAPEVFFDDLKKRYMVFWSSNIGPWASPNGEGRIYYTTTTDFKNFTEPEILFRNGFPAGGKAGNIGPIDAFILKDGPRKYLLFYKQDDNTGVPNIFHRVGNTPEGPWGKEVGPITPSTADEGASAIKINGKYHVYTDPFESDFMYVYISADLKNWERKVTNLKMKHGTIIEISKAQAEQLLTMHL